MSRAEALRKQLSALVGVVKVILGVFRHVGQIVEQLGDAKRVRNRDGDGLRGVGHAAPPSAALRAVKAS